VRAWAAVEFGRSFSFGCCWGWGVTSLVSHQWCVSGWWTVLRVGSSASVSEDPPKPSARVTSPVEVRVEEHPGKGESTWSTGFGVSESDGLRSRTA
jgi:hypothetical protein